MPITVKIQIAFEPRANDEVEDLGREAIEVLQKQPGFLGIHQSLAPEGNEITALLQWDSEEAFHACKRSPYWLAVLPIWSDLQENYEISLSTTISGDV